MATGSEMQESQTTATRRSAESLLLSNSSFEDFQTPVKGKSEAEDPPEENILILPDIYLGPDVIEVIDCLDYGEGTGRDDGSDAKVDKGNVKNWAYVNFSGLTEKEASRFLYKLIKMCVSIGMDFFFDANKVCACNPVSSHGYRKDFGGYGLPSHKIFYQVWRRWKPYRASYCISARLYSYSWYGINDEEVEKVCTSFGFPFQCFSSQDARALKDGFLRKAANEIRDKVRQHHHKGVQCPLVFDDIPFVSEAPTVIFGADISSSSLEEGSISIASVVASINWPGANKYKALVSYQPHNELAIKDLFNPEKENVGMFSELLIAFHKNTEKWPQKIIFFRNGGTGCQLKDAYLCEVDYIKNACSRLCGRIPSVTFVVVAQRPCDESRIMREVVHGSVLGDDNCIPIKFEFSSGTSREELPCDDVYSLMKMTSHLMSLILYAPVSVPAVFNGPTLD